MYVHLELLSVLQPSTSERPGVAVVPPSVPGRSHGSYVCVPKSCMRRQKSTGKYFRATLDSQLKM